jgi:hypothetical protein
MVPWYWLLWPFALIPVALIWRRMEKREENWEREQERMGR